MGRKKTRAQDIKRRLSEDDASLSPFASIKLVEKKEPERKKEIVRPVPKKPSEIVQGYNPSSSFADILYAYEHTGNPYVMPSKARKAEIASYQTDFGAILDKWENRGKTPVRKQKSVETPKSTYKPTKSFGDILSRYEGKSVPETPNAGKTEIIEDLPDDAPLFRKESEDEKRSPEAAWSIFGSNENFVRKAEEKSPVQNEKKEAKRVSEPYKPTSSFADILRSFEEGGRKRADKAEPVIKAVPEKEENAEVLSADNLFKKESDDERRSPEAVWSVFGNNRIPEQRKTEVPSCNENKTADAVSHSSYESKGAFPELLTAYERKAEKTFDEIMKEKGDNKEHRPALTISKLRTMLPQATLDLHGDTISEAESEIRTFLAECAENRIRKISIITGKGLHSEDGVGVLRDAAIRVLSESGMVSEMCSAPLSAGGAGALWIILKA